jgi:hypothetical protein
MVKKGYESNRKRRMLEDAKYNLKRRMDLKRSGAKSNKRPERKKNLQTTDAARALPMSTVLPLDTLPADHRQSLISVFETLFDASWGSKEGIPIHTDAAGSNTPKCNITRPAVVRSHFGKELHDGSDAQYQHRVDYGAGTHSVGTDPRRAEIRVMTPEMENFGIFMMKFLRETKIRCRNNIDLDEEFNSVTALVYTGRDALPVNDGSSLGYHCDCNFSTTGVFNERTNTQKERTPTVVVTLGDQRVLHMKKRRVRASGKWSDNCYGTLKFPLEANSIFLLHPDDEKPKKRAGQKYLSQYQHGILHVPHGLSLSLVYRVVTSTAKVCVADNRKVLVEKDHARLGKILRFHTEKDETVATHHDEALMEFMTVKKSLEANFKTYVRAKMAEWGWRKL